MKVAFNLGSIPVRIHASFFLLTLFLGTGMKSSTLDVPYLAAWTLVVLVSVLLHELGHALVGKAFGLAPQIDLHSMGGLTSWTEPKKLSSLKRIAISLAGPMVGIVIGVAVFVLRAPSAEPPTLGDRVAWDIVWVNGGWALFNLLPILPMDGGSVLFHTLDGITKGRGEKPARIVSIVLAALIGLVALKIEWTWVAIMGGLYAFQNFQALRSIAPPEDTAALRESLQRAYVALERHDGETAVHHARFVVQNTRDPVLQRDGVRLLAFAFLLIGAWGPLMQLMESGGAGVIGDEELAKFERAATELGRAEEAQRIASLRKGAPPPTAPAPRPDVVRF